MKLPFRSNGNIRANAAGRPRRPGPPAPHRPPLLRPDGPIQAIRRLRAPRPRRRQPVPRRLGGPRKEARGRDTGLVLRGRRGRPHPERLRHRGRVPPRSHAALGGRDRFRIHGRRGRRKGDVPRHPAVLRPLCLRAADKHHGDPVGPVGVSFLSARTKARRLRRGRCGLGPGPIFGPRSGQKEGQRRIHLFERAVRHGPRDSCPRRRGDQVRP